MSYFNIEKLRNYLNQCGTYGAPAESGWYVLEVKEEVYGVGFYDDELKEADVATLRPTDRIRRSAAGEYWVETHERASYSFGMSPGILRFAPLRFDLKD